MSKEIYITPDGDYFSQLNNKFKPFVSCQVTSVIMALTINGISFDYPKDMQPEDYLFQLCERPEAYDQVAKLAPWFIDSDGKSKFPPREIHSVLAWVTNNLLVKKEVDFPYLSPHGANIQEILFSVLKKNAVVTGTVLVPDGHIVVTSGFITNQENIENVKSADEIDLDKVTSIIIDDPYGDYNSGYKKPQGNHTVLTKEIYIAKTVTINETKNKLVHFIHG